VDWPPELTCIYFGDDQVERALDCLDLVMHDARLVEALTYLFNSNREYSFRGGDITLAEVAQPPDDTPVSSIDRGRVERAFHECYKAIEALLGGAPGGHSRSSGGAGLRGAVQLYCPRHRPAARSGLTPQVGCHREAKGAAGACPCRSR
jgi:hypothetical protein